MLREKIIEEKVELDCDCSIIGSINIISGKWKPVIIWMLLSGLRRFGELHKGIQGIALKVLSRHLKELEADGIINRKVYAEVRQRWSIHSLKRNVAQRCDAAISRMG